MEHNTDVKLQPKSLCLKIFICKSQVYEGLSQTMHERKQRRPRNSIFYKAI